MPGLYGLVKPGKDNIQTDLDLMSGTLCYNDATTIENFLDNGIVMGCAHLGTGGQQALYESADLAVLFFGYLTKPSIPPGGGLSGPAAAAHCIHDGYIKQGVSTFNEVGGAFAAAIWDRRSQTLILVNDRLGLRPIYFGEYNNKFYFASEVKGILADPHFPRRINQAALADFFHYGFILGDKTFFQDIYLLPPASYLRLQNDHQVISSYWEITFPERITHHPDSWYTDQIYESLKIAVKRMVRSDLKFGLSLSGGLDSRWIAAFLEIYDPECLTFTLGTPGSDDTPSAKAVAAQTGLQNHYWEISPSAFAENAEKYNYLVDGMDSFCHMDEFTLTVQVGDYVDISVGGLLGDGLFGYEINPVSALLRKRDVVNYRLYRTRGVRLPKSIMTQVFGNKTAQDFSDLAVESLQRSFLEAPSNRGYQIIQYFDLRQAQRRMANTAQLAKLSYVDIYHPIADEEVVETALHLPWQQLIFERAYRRAMAVKFPDLARIIWTFTLTPPTISTMGLIRQKITHFTLGRWLKGTPLGNHPLIRPRRYFVDYLNWTRGELRQFVQETLISEEVEMLNVFDMDGLQKAIDEHMVGNLDITSFLGTAVAVALWSRNFYSTNTPRFLQAISQTK